MNGGFRFCGTDISVLGLEYVPDMKDTYVYAGTQTAKKSLKDMMAAIIMV